MPLLQTIGNQPEHYQDAHLFLDFQRKTAASMTEPTIKQSMEQQAKMMDMQADWFKRVDINVELTDAGIELHESVDAQ